MTAWRHFSVEVTLVVDVFGHRRRHVLVAHELLERLGVLDLFVEQRAERVSEHVRRNVVRDLRQSSASPQGLVVMLRGLPFRPQL